MKERQPLVRVPQTTQGSAAVVAQFIDRWRAAVEAKDMHAAAALFHPTMRFFTPVVHGPKTNHEEVRTILTWIVEIIQDFEYVSTAVGEHAGRPLVVLWFRGRVLHAASGKHLDIEGADYMTLDSSDGRIVDFRVMLRPMQAYLTVAERMKRNFESLAKL